MTGEIPSRAPETGSSGTLQIKFSSAATGLCAVISSHRFRLSAAASSIAVAQEHQ
jgi:hypothetical protein